MSERRPNFLIFMTDQQRGDSVLPEHLCQTPVLDGFRRDAVTFSECFCPSPHCCPSRASFFTGLYPSEHGVWNNITVPNALSRGLNPGTRAWSEALVAAGYHCDFVGKWHVDSERLPADFGWSVHSAQAAAAPPSPARVRLPQSDWQRYEKVAEDAGAELLQAPDLSERKPGEILRPGWNSYTHYGVKDNPFKDGDVVAKGCELIASRQGTDEPWCCYVGTLGPHDPYFVPQEFLDRYRDVEIDLPASFSDMMRDKPAFYRRTRGFFDQLSEAEQRDAIRHYWAFCSYEDHLFGQLLEALEASGEADNTVVIYCSDHGDYVAEHGLWCKGLPCFRGAYHVPMIVRWPGVTDGVERRVDAYASLVDVGPTLLEIAGIDHDLQMSGASWVPFLRGEEPSQWRQAICTQSNGNEQYGIQRSITCGGWKYVYNGFDFDELYDLSSDPDEVVNLAERPEVDARKRELCAQLWAFAHAHNDHCTNAYIMVGMAPVGPAAGCVPGLADVHGLQRDPVPAG